MDEFRIKGRSTENLVALVNKSPVWDPSKNMYILDFRGRVTQASIRNFQAVRAEDGAPLSLRAPCPTPGPAPHPARALMTMSCARAAGL